MDYCVEHSSGRCLPYNTPDSNIHDLPSVSRFMVMRKPQAMALEMKRRMMSLSEADTFVDGANYSSHSNSGPRVCSHAKKPKFAVRIRKLQASSFKARGGQHCKALYVVLRMGNLKAEAPEAGLRPLFLAVPRSWGFINAPDCLQATTSISLSEQHVC